MNDKQLDLYHVRPMDLLTGEYTDEIHETAKKILKLVPGGRKLNGEQAAELAVASLIMRANPFEGEIHYMYGVGPYPGIPLYRRRAKEFILAEYGPNHDYHISFRKAKANEANFDPEKGDVAWIATLKDTQSSSEWFGNWARWYQMLSREGMDPAEARKVADEKVGPEPTWEGIGVVWGEEEHGKTHEKSGRVMEMFDRNERAQKRAEKQALKKKYPALSYIKDPDAGDTIIDADAEMIIREVAARIEAEIAEERARLPRGQDVILDELGFDVSKSEEDTNRRAEELEKQLDEQDAEKEAQRIEDADQSLTLAEIFVKEKIAQNVHNADSIIKLLDLDKGDIYTDQAIRMGKLYRAWRDQGANTQDAADLAKDGVVPGEEETQSQLPLG